MKIPVQVETVDTETGQSTHGTAQFMMMPAPKGTCEECGRNHDPEMPHDAISLRYQYHHYGRTGRWPDWRDAMAHCSEQLREQWGHALTEAGIDYEAGQLRPLPGGKSP